MANKIARRTTGQATLTGTQTKNGNGCLSSSPADCESQWPKWMVSYDVYPWVSGQEAGSSVFGWFVTESGMITVPDSAAIGHRFSYYEKYEGPHPINSPALGKLVKNNFEFEVVCMTVEVKITESYRDATVYRLSCTAEVSGGIAPYTYHWSGPTGKLISGQDTSTAEIEIPVNSGGTISVSVADGGNPPCNASASFDVCSADVTCDFTIALISTPPIGATGPSIYECNSISQSPLVGIDDHKWSPTAVWVSPDGVVARFSFPDNNEHSIDLSVREPLSGYRAFRTHKVGGYEFIVSTDPSGENGATGTVTGTRDGMEFGVMVKVQATGNFTGPPPAQVTLEFSRAANNSEGTQVGTLVAGSNPPRYEFDWGVRLHQGRWAIRLRDYRSNTVAFQIDKRRKVTGVAKFLN